MRINSKIDAFTLNEMVIVMVISVIVMGLAFTVLSMVQRHMWSIKQNFSLNMEIDRLEQALWIDTIRYNTINYNAIEDELKFSSAIDSTIYRFKPDFVLKDSDTLNIGIDQKVFFFTGNKVNSGNIDAFRFQISKKRKDQKLFVFKRTDATQFID